MVMYQSHDMYIWSHDSHLVVIVPHMLQEVGNETFFKNRPVLELIQSIRSDHTLFAKYQHSSKLVKQVNSFARTECDLPNGWEKKVDPKSNKVCVCVGGGGGGGGGGVR